MSELMLRAVMFNQIRNLKSYALVWGTFPVFQEGQVSKTLNICRRDAGEFNKSAGRCK